MIKTIRYTRAATLLLLLLVACASAPADTADNADVVQEPATAELEGETSPDQVDEPLPTPESKESIDPFAEGLSAGNTEAFPFPAAEDASDFDNMLGLYSYTTSFDMDRLLTLYQAALPSLGYSIISDTVIPGMAILNYEGDGEVLTLNITLNEDGTNAVSFLVGLLQ